MSFPYDNVPRWQRRRKPWIRFCCFVFLTKIIEEPQWRVAFQKSHKDKSLFQHAPHTSITPTLIICAWPHVRSNAWVDHLVRKVFAPLMIDLVRAKKVTKAHCFNNISEDNAFWILLIAKGRPPARPKAILLGPSPPEAQKPEARTALNPLKI